jgi:hypothetical protein
MRNLKKLAARPRIGSMLRLDFYRLFHTPVFFIMLAISAIIPAMVLAMTGVPTATDSLSVISSSPDVQVAQSAIEYTNTWQLVERAGGSAAVSPLDFGGYANINMVFIFAGLLMAIFVAHDYLSGFVKNIFAAHSKKMDYVISKSAIGIFSGAGMIVAYLFGTILAGLVTGKAFDVSVSGLLLCIISKILLMGIFCSLFLSIAVFFRNRLWLTIVFTFLFGMMLYPAASVATLDSSILTALISLMAGVIGALAIGAVSTFILNRRDLA